MTTLLFKCNVCGNKNEIGLDDGKCKLCLTISYMRADYPISGHFAKWYFYRSYVGTALGTTANESNEDGDFLDSNYDESDLYSETREVMLADCASFYVANEIHIHCENAPLSNGFEGSIASREAAMAGHDFWLTRCGHGAGFWDGDWPEPHAAALDNSAKTFGNVDLYIGDIGTARGKVCA